MTAIVASPAVRVLSETRFSRRGWRLETACFLLNVVKRTCARRLGFFANIEGRTGRSILKTTRFSGNGAALADGFSLHGFHSLRSEVAMSIFSYRKHLRFLSQTQRRCWWDQKKRLTPRVVIGAAYVPPNVTREFAYIKVG